MHKIIKNVKKPRFLPKTLKTAKKASQRENDKSLRENDLFLQKNSHFDPFWVVHPGF